MLTKAPKGTKDVLPQESYKWQYIEKVIRDLCDCYGYKEIRTPVFEHTELFERGVGDTTDVVQKEMYTFKDKGERSITLRPEGTASAARSYIENGLHAASQPIKMYYFTSCYRYERPQKGRLREHHQFGVEVFGSEKPSVDAEIISMAVTIFQTLGVSGLELRLNSIGCPDCRKQYHDKLKAYLHQYLGELCPTCNERFEKNPLRILDCKSERCMEIAKGAPVMLENLCDACKQHFDSVRTYLDNMHIEYVLDPFIVRGLDYYTRTVFEIVSKDIGAQGSVAGGGRYDGLIEQLGGAPTPGIGFAMGIERLLLTMEGQSIQLPEPEPIKLFIANIGDTAEIVAQSLVFNLRKHGISAEKDHLGRSLKAQMKYADRIGALYTMVLGDDEIKNDTVELKNMKTGKTEKVDLMHDTGEFPLAQWLINN